MLLCHDYYTIFDKIIEVNFGKLSNWQASNRKEKHWQKAGAE